MQCTNNGSRILSDLALKTFFEDTSHPSAVQKPCSDADDANFEVAS